MELFNLTYLVIFILSMCIIYLKKLDYSFVKCFVISYAIAGTSKFTVDGVIMLVRILNRML